MQQVRHAYLSAMPGAVRRGRTLPGLRPACGRLPVFQLDGLTIAKAVVAAVVLAGSTGAAWGLLFFRVFSIPYLPWLILLGIGFLTGEGISMLAVNRKRGRVLQYIAAAGCGGQLRGG